jgi:hypothetical protein
VELLLEQEQVVQQVVVLLVELLVELLVGQHLIKRFLLVDYLE